MFNIKNKFVIAIIHFGLPLLFFYVNFILRLRTMAMRIALAYSVLYLLDRFYPKILKSIKK